jgi:hypothetical protein
LNICHRGRSGLQFENGKKSITSEVCIWSTKHWSEKDTQEWWRSSICV